MRKVSIALLVLVLAVTMVGTTVAQAPGISPKSGTGAGGTVALAPRMPNAVLWDQPLYTGYYGAILSQDFTDFATYSSYVGDDFTVADVNGWTITDMYVPGDMWNGTSMSLANAISLNWAIYADAAGVPAGDPSGAGSPPVWSLSLAPTDPAVVLSIGYFGFLSNTMLTLPTPLNLPAGTYWLLFWPQMSFATYGEYGRVPATTANLSVAQWVNPGGAFGNGTAWQPWTVIDPNFSPDSAFTLSGTVNPTNTMHLAALNLAKSGIGPYTITATGVVHDQNHLGLVKVKVSGQLALPDRTKLAFSGKTNAAGQFSIVMANLTLTGKYKFCVKKLTKLGYTYNPAANEVPTCATIILP